MHVPVYGMIYVVIFFGVIYLLLKLHEFLENQREIKLGYRVGFLHENLLRAGPDDFAVTYHENGPIVYFNGKIINSKYVLDFTLSRNVETLSKFSDKALVQQRIVSELQRIRTYRKRFKINLSK